ncbi:MAG: carbohydrate ABC transporter permease [Anaerolineae bacterium]|nr:carbohydrate ABC transporter permease [Anaerolineae bacterium]MDW8097937.1 carbohydrate ABC transporter permease [Anaerolineae bacterium]
MANMAQVMRSRFEAFRRLRFHSPWFYLGEGLIWMLLICMAIIEVAPILWMFSTSLRDPADSFKLPPDFLPTSWRWDNYLAVIRSEKINFPLFFWNSLKIALIVTGSQLLTCSLAAFAFARLRFPGRDFLFFLFLASMMVPAQVTTVPVFIIIRSLRLMDTHWALILPAMTSAFGVFLLRQFFLTLPGELIDAAKIDGASFFRIYWQIMLPLVGPGLSALGVFTFLGSWNNFYGPLLFLRSWDKLTFPLALVTLQGYMGMGNRSHVLAGIMMSIVPVLIFFLLAQRFVIRGIALTGLKG